MKKQCERQKVFDIRLNWQKAVRDSDDINSSFFDMFFNLDTYELVRAKDIDANDERFIPFLKVNKDNYVNQFIEIISDCAVTKWFNSAKNKDELLYRYRVFIDWNCLGESERYRTYLNTSKELIKWCEKNEIEYVNQVLSPPTAYIYNDNAKLKTKNWQLPEIK